MKYPVWVLAGMMSVGLWALASPGQAALVPACQVENPPPDCQTMWAVIAHVRVPKQSSVAVNLYPRCGSRFMKIDWGRTVADAFLAEADRNTLSNLALDVSEALQKKRLPQIARHIQGDAAAFIEENFSKVMPKAWSLSSHGYDLSLCAPVIAAVPADATVKEFRFRAWDENLGERECTRGRWCSIGEAGYCTGASETSIGGITLYTAIFKNWSTQWAREGRMIIFFELPAGRVPLQMI
jgi:hypothetical protein